MKKNIFVRTLVAITLSVLLPMSLTFAGVERVSICHILKLFITYTKLMLMPDVMSYRQILLLETGLCLISMACLIKRMS